MRALWSALWFAVWFVILPLGLLALIALLYVSLRYRSRSGQAMADSMAPLVGDVNDEAGDIDEAIYER